MISHSATFKHVKDVYFSPYWLDTAVPIFMIISGYVFSLSVQKNHIRTVSDYFSRAFFIPKFLRFFIPYIVFFGVEILILKYFAGFKIIHNAVFLFMTGGVYGPGNYYVPVLMQFLIIFPFILMTMKNFKSDAWKGWILLSVIQLILEYAAVKSDMPAGFYRLMFFCYICFVTAGIWLAQCHVESKTIRKMFVCGIIFIWIMNYTSFKIPLFYDWKTSSMPVVLYVAPIVWATLKLNAKLKIYRLPQLIGKSSYHIFLVQTCYYTFFNFEFNGTAITCCANTIVCISVGICFYLLDKGFRIISVKCLNGILKYRGNNNAPI